MNRLTSKDWVCLVSDETLAAKRRARLNYDPYLASLLNESLWRQIELTATADSIKLSLSNVNEEAARGGYCGLQEACLTRTLTWDELQDDELVDRLLAREQVAVYRKVLALVAILKARTAPLREFLQAS